MSLEAIPLLLGMFRDERRYNKELTDKALRAINEAVVATRKYEARHPNLQDRDLAEEAAIGGLWHEAAIVTRHVSDEFASRLHDKSLYWFNGFHWSAAEATSRRIDWDSIHQQVTELINADKAAKSGR